jgi:glutamate-1-semialdehyde 2,1-aminomutase
MIEQPVKWALAVAGTAALGALLAKAARRLELSVAKHPSLAGHAKMSRRVAGLLPFYEFDGDRFFRADDAPDDVVGRRRAGFARLSELYRERFPQTRRATAEAQEGISDLQFTDRYRVPFPFRKVTAEHLGAGAFLRSAEGRMLTDLDGNRFYDVAGSYGVNLLGHDFYKSCVERGWERVREVGTVLGPYHPLVASNVARLRTISGLDEVSFHMSGTEAVMQAVRLARYHTRRTHLVRFCGAYHGWWGEVQPGPGNPTTARETYTLAEMSERTLHVLRTRRDIACVLVNPLQAMHPNAGAPTDASLVGNGRRAAFDRAAYTRWLCSLREVCDERGIVLIFDEVFLGFRLAPGGAQEYFGVRADLVTYGKTLGGGLPVGVLCGRSAFMRRYREDRPADICFARGTFNSHPAVMGAMAEFLDRLESPEIRALYEGLDATWDARAARLNHLLGAENLPVRVANMSSVWTVLYDAPSRYNWMLQFYLRAEGLALPWTGTGRLIFSLDYTEEDFDAVAGRFVAAAGAMREDGWFWTDQRPGAMPLKRRLLGETLGAMFARRGREKV